MRRYYICEIVIDPNDTERGYYPAVADHAIDSVSAPIWIGSDGKPTTTHTIATVVATNHGPLIADTRATVLPDFPLDAKLTAMQAAVRARMMSDIAARGFNTASLANADGYRDVINMIGRQIEPAYAVK